MKNKVFKIEYGILLEKVKPGISRSGENSKKYIDYLYLNLKNSVERAIKNGYQIEFDLDGTIGYSTYFIKNVFSKLLFEIKNAKKYVTFKSNRDPYILNMIEKNYKEFDSNNIKSEKKVGFFKRMLNKILSI
jgi:hypothetical protein